MVAPLPWRLSLTWRLATVCCFTATANPSRIFGLCFLLSRESQWLPKRVMGFSDDDTPPQEPRALTPSSDSVRFDSCAGHNHMRVTASNDRIFLQVYDDLFHWMPPSGSPATPYITQSLCLGVSCGASNDAGVLEEFTGNSLQGRERFGKGRHLKSGATPAAP